MLLRKSIFISFMVISLTLPVLSTAKEVPASATQNRPTNTETNQLAKKTNWPELSGGVNSSEQSFSLENYMSNSLDGFEEIVTKLDSGRVIVLYSPISTPVDSYQNYFKTGYKVRRILQELLPLNIF